MSCVVRWALAVGAFLGVAMLAGAAQAQYRIEAFSGRPFGVGRVEVHLPQEQWPEGLGLAGMGIFEKSGRVLYPVVDTKGMIPGVVKDVFNQARRPLGQIIGNILNQVEEPSADIYFLFQGDAPLDLAIQSRQIDRAVVQPRTDPRRGERLFSDWWQRYSHAPGLLAAAADYPPMVKNYLEAMLARRLNLALRGREKEKDLWKEMFRRETGLLLNTEWALIDIERERMLGLLPLQGTADQPLPEPLVTPPPEYPAASEKVDIEPIAMRVPPECFYIRFGSYANFLWFQDTMARWGGDLQNLMAKRGLDYGVNRRIEEQLVLKQSALSRLFGGSVVGDVAMIGTDMYFPDGASFGLLFYATTPMLLANDIQQQRTERIKKGDGVTDEKVKIGGREVSLLSTPDGSVRSYYLADGPYTLVTRSATLVRRFLEAANGQSLGKSEGFRHARGLMPLTRNDTVFLYFSHEFFQNMVSPPFRMELTRRLNALTDIELAEMAILAAAAEGAQGGSIENLVTGGFLPPEFGPRPDGSRAVLKDGEVFDSLRGRRGAMVPLADVPVTAASPAEADEYRAFVDYFHAKWGTLDPMLVAMKRQATEGGREHVVIDLRMTPFSRENLARIQDRVGPPDKRQLAPVQGDIAHAEVVLPQQRLLGGLQDVGLQGRPLEGPILFSGVLRNLFVGYVGADGPLGPLAILNFGMPAGADPSGFASGPLGGWRLFHGPFTLFSFQPDLLAAVGRQLHYVDAERPAQARIHIGDVSHARITPTLNNLGYARTRETSRGNLRLLHQIDQQFHVPTKTSREAAEFLLDARLVCPLGGDYVLRQSPDGAAWWMSTALEKAPEGGLFSTVAPEGFLAPPLDWFRGLDAEALVSPETLSVHAEIDMQMPPAK